MKHLIVLTLLLFGMLNLYGCKTPVETSPVPDITKTTVQGKITTVAGLPLAGVSVSDGNTTAVTDLQGAYILNVTAGDVSITANLQNYAENSHIVSAVDSRASTLDMVLAKVDKIVVFDVNAGASITTKGAVVDLPAAGIINSDGSVYMGNVVAKVSFNQVTSAAGRDTFPGDYLGQQTDGQQTVLQSYGFIDVTLEDEIGNPLQIANGKTATLSYPVDDNITTTPATIPLWYYDKVQGIWIEDGVATYNPTNQTYVGTVSHFTTWNLDVRLDGSTYNGCIVDKNDTPMPDAYIAVSTPGWNKSFHNQQVDGSFTLLNAPAGLALTLVATVGNSSSTPQSVTLSSNENHTAANCLQIDDTVSNLNVSVSGKIVTDQAISSMELIYQDSIFQNSVPLSLNPDGSFTSIDFLRPADNTVSISFEISNHIMTQKFILDTGQKNTHVGLIEPKLTTVTGCSENSSNIKNTYTGISLDEAFPVPYDLYSSASKLLSYTDDQGDFSITLPQDNASHKLYAFSTNHTESNTAFSFIADSDNITLPSCLQTASHQPVTIEASVIDSAGVTDIRLRLINSEMSVPVDGNNGGIGQMINSGMGTLNGNATSGQATTDSDAVYILAVTGVGSNDYSGVQLQVTVAGHYDQLITVPTIPSIMYGELLALQIEVHQGQVTVKLLFVQYEPS